MTSRNYSAGIRVRRIPSAREYRLSEDPLGCLDSAAPAARRYSPAPHAAAEAALGSNALASVRERVAVGQWHGWAPVQVAATAP